MRILLLASEYLQDERPRDGNFINDQALAILRNGIQVHVAFVEYKSARSFSLKNLLKQHFQIVANDEGGILTFRQKGWNTWLNSFWGGVVWAHLTKRLVGDYIAKYGPPDLIHAHNIFWAGYSALLISEKYNIPYVITEHSSRINTGHISVRMGKYAQKVLSGASEIIAVSSSLSNVMKKYSGNNKIKIIPNVVDTDFFIRPTITQQTGQFNFLAIGNMLPNKGFDVLIRAFAKKFRETSHVKLVFGGDGPQLKALENLTVNLGVAHLITFKGAMTRSQVREAIWNSHVLVLPSFSETFGVVLIESLSAGVPVIASRCGGPEDIVKPGVGYLFEPGNFEELSTIMGDMVCNYDYNPESIRRYAVRKYSEKHVSDTLIKMYRDVLAFHHPEQI